MMVLNDMEVQGLGSELPPTQYTPVRPTLTLRTTASGNLIVRSLLNADPNEATQVHHAVLTPREVEVLVSYATALLENGDS